MGKVPQATLWIMNRTKEQWMLEVYLGSPNSGEGLMYCGSSVDGEDI